MAVRIKCCLFDLPGISASRKGSEKGAGAWCPKQRNESDIVDDWLEVDLQELKVVNLIETQGRFGNGQGKEYTENYRVEYRRIKGGPFIRYKDKSRRELFKGNRDTHTAEINELDPPIIARWVRILVVKTHITPCLRLELHGCVWRDGLLSYSMPQGDKRSPDNDFSDLTYDGKLTMIVVNNLNNNNNNNISSSYNSSSNNNKLNVVLGSWSADAKNNILFINNNNNNNKLNSSNIYNEDFADDSTHNRHHHHNQYFKHHHHSSQKSKQMTNNIVSSNNAPSATTTNNNNAQNSSASFVYLSGGLGQLTDGAEGHTNFRADVDNSGRKGYEWVAWRNDTASAIIGQLGSHGRPVVTLIFEFEKPRNFTSVRMHCGNRFNMDVRVFQKAILTFSFDRFDDFTTSDSTQKTSSVSSNPSDGSAGEVIFDKRESLTYIYNRDILLDFPRNVIINIGCKIGRFVKVELFFDARWIMISEIRFESGWGFFHCFLQALFEELL
ncbi:hypothetical protein HELRODRAFT_183383 [Helobdella robusta]|uniref:F5/8 type C domain-containing protein n=1 Tax=Helobdella robusta TaxID=6412 RepID=T1FJJ5_HELRO|nr:hypothetical protein HELRODRAFT_183383 [Helobdella robusta]ESO11280.1 hypothetical protein HELRODRAFT_183383 [Helobdella robusta]